MDATLSNKIKFASFVCTIMVVFRHSLNYLAFWGSYTGKGMSGFVENACSILTEVAVPYFFLISGLFFFRRLYNTIDAYFQMIEKKSKSLLIPFLFWNLIGGCILYFILHESLGDNPISLIYNCLLSKWYAPLWFVRDLIIMMLLVPLYRWSLNYRYLRLCILAILFYFWYPIDCSLLSTEGLLFFYAGGIISNNQHILDFKINKWLLLSMLLLWVISCMFSFPQYHILIHKVNTILGIIVLWGMIDYFPQNNAQLSQKIWGTAFFIYVTHFYLIKALKRMIASQFYENDVIALATYLLLPVVICFILCCISLFFQKKLPKVYSIITGNRF